MTAREPIRWVRVFPELALFDSADERRTAIREAFKLARKFDHKHLLRNLVVLVIGAGCLVMWADVFYDQFIRPHVPLPGPLKAVLFGGLPTVMGFLIGQRMLRAPVRRRLRQQLNAAGKPVCMECGYDLRSVSEPRCPERGREFDPRLITEPPPAE